MELSVDLGRNDISFLLLSMRGSDDGRGRQPPPTATAAKPEPAAADEAGGAVRRRRPEGRTGATEAARGEASRPAAATQQTARLFGGDGGTPIPNAGFLGFDTSRR